MRRLATNFAFAAMVVLFLTAHLSGKDKDGDDDPTGLTLTKIADLSFGDILTNGNGGRVTLEADGHVFYDNVGPCPGGRLVQPASFELTGEPLLHYYVDLPKNEFIRNTERSGQMKVEDFTKHSETGFALDKNGRDVLYIGATLKINPNERTGYYEGEFRVNVNYE